MSSYDHLNSNNGNSNWLENEKRRSRKSKIIVISSLIAIIIVIVVGVSVGVTVSKNSKHNNASTTTGGGGGSGGNSSSPVDQPDPNDPSNFVKDPRLHVSFYGMAYTPAGSQYPACGNNLSSVITDIQLLSQLTTRIRLYGADCNQSALVLEAIKQTKTNVSVYLANYNEPTDHTVYTRQKAAIQAAIQTYGTDHILGVTVGNEYMLNYLNANGATDPNSATGNAGAALLKADIDDTRTMIAGMNLPKKIPVGNSDAGAYFNTLVLEDIDYGMANVHPWFANVTIAQAAAWTADFFNTQNVQPAALLSNHPQMSIAETGWPTQSSDLGDATNGASAASEANLQIFLDTFVCQANQNGTEYFYFEFFDEQWKDIQFGGVEGWWGLFHANKTLKNIQIPNCPLS
ncbi:glycoside hydrolase family 17 protein [Jaapia argillacea MUCL 33604]|uniref:glucan endo-1,3-beta-D-glucosidase n=1 Tax=Jaapia argillacea MUCL 33604 TaxID=933084 RepID=A0A067Q0Y2_9AGAM|nr:glycoside hydrolase family 17 protein [Jaapia argillacea MUCL 33604]